MIIFRTERTSDSVDMKLCLLLVARLHKKDITLQQRDNFTISKDILVVCDCAILASGSTSELKYVVVRTVVKTFIFC